MPFCVYDQLAERERLQRERRSTAGVDLRLLLLCLFWNCIVSSRCCNRCAKSEASVDTSRPHIYRAIACPTSCSLNSTAVIGRDGHSGLRLDGVSGSCCRCCRLQNKNLDFRHQHFLLVDVGIPCLYDAIGVCLGEDRLELAVPICENDSYIADP